ncbi:hypothetical protein [Lentzea sp. E54]|uniref:hypothetical protein n=1 Tax=Lentzea xerophila TaxID=3435883 RepID=UPI003DA358A6
MVDTAGRARSEGTEVTLRSKAMVLDFEGECQVEHDGDSVRLTGVRLVAELPDAGGPEDGGTVVLAQAGDSKQAGRDLVVPLEASVTQPGGKVRLTAVEDARWTSGPGGGFECAEVDFVLPEAPEATVLTVRGLIVRNS